VQLKTGQDLPCEGVEAALDEVLANYKSELGLTDKENDQLEHFQVSTRASYQYTVESNCIDFFICDHGKPIDSRKPVYRAMRPGSFCQAVPLKKISVTC